MALKWNLETPMGAMRVGDSFFVPCVQCRQIENGVRHLAKLYRIKIKVRVQFERYVKGVRVWRLE
jgi:hypothetical protein